MRTIDLDATTWKTIDDFYDALLSAIGAPKIHGRNLNALTDSMIWGGINAVEPPYTIVISGAANLPKDVRREVEMAKQALAEDRADFRRARGTDVDVTMNIVS
jgi:RNAse (barnase) inhibitor barstar